MDEGEVSFAKLVRRHSGDAPPSAVLDELERVGAVKRSENAMLVLVTRAYIPQAEDTDKVAFMGAAVGQLVRTIDRNFWGAPGDAALQRIVSNNNISSDKIDEFRSLSKREGQQLLEQLDKWLTENETRSEYHDPGDMHRVGMGLYYFEDD
jgi:hypothetical protein